jgi:hypothetical protein
MQSAAPKTAMATANSNAYMDKEAHAVTAVTLLLQTNTSAEGQSGSQWHSPKRSGNVNSA